MTMKSATPFSIMDAPLTGINLVEASAGTGKTWNIEALTVRLMMVRRMLPGDMLVVTFTEAATQELRERIYKRLIEVIRVLKNPSTAGEDPFLRACADHFAHDPEQLRHLERCKQRFDEAAISTIHGFCKTVLSEFSHLTRTDIDVTIETEGSGALIDDAVDDFWRQYNAHEATWHDGMLASLLYGPLKRENLGKMMRLLLRQADVNLLYPDPPEGVDPTDIRGILNRLMALVAEIREIWYSEEDLIRQQLADTKISGGGLDKNYEGIRANLFGFLDKPIDFEAVGKTLDPRKFGSRYLREEKLNKGFSYRSDHPVHDLIDQARELAAYIPDLEQRRALEVIRRFYRERCARDGVTTFDDLLRNVAEALRDDAPENGGSGALHAGLRKRYPAGLIDEFQDTDPVQFEIFRRIFLDDPNPNRLLYLIGDPKQAIYKFRGADLRTYIKARSLVENQFTLEVNFRSAENMVAGVNAFFEGDYSFIDPELSFQPARAAHAENPFFSGVDAEVLVPAPVADEESGDAEVAGDAVGDQTAEVAGDAVGDQTAEVAGGDANAYGLHFPRIGAGPFGSKGAATRAIIAWTSSHIARSLESARVDERTGFTDTTGRRKSLTAGDIAVLVSSHTQARQLKMALEAVGVPAVVGGDASVFTTDDARLVNLLLDVLVDPLRLSAIRTLLVSRLVGMDVPALASLMQNDLEWSKMLEIFANAREEALKKGVLTGIRYVSDALDMEKRLISWSDGERRMTNFRHISELLYEEQRRGHRNLAGLAQWLRSRRNDPGLDTSDGTQMRLESDENRVTIMTMHSSKGLQFPVVYAPFLWESREINTDSVLYMDAAQDTFVLDFGNRYAKALAEVRGADPKRVAEAGIRIQSAEDLEDRVRLMYVAVTRARYRCYVPHTMVVNRRSDGVKSAFTAMLLRDPAAGAIYWRDLSQFSRADGLPADDIISALLSRLDTTRFCQYPGAIDFSARYRPDAASDQLVVRHISEKARLAMKQHVFIESYSSLKDRATSTTLGDMESEPPARDHASADVSSALRDPESEPTARDHASYDSPGGSTKEHTIYTFPKGAHTGTFWHHIFEHIDFTDPAGFEPEIHRACEMFGFNADTWDQVLRGMVHHVVDTDLDRFRLADVPPSRALPEMEFYLPYADDAMNKFLQWIITQMHDENPEVVSAETGTQAAPDREDLRHYLTGFIDLLVEHNGKYYIIDYKSDYLGDTPEAYAGPALLTHMREKRYVMQYYVYALALYLFLRNRLGDFDFDAVFGGVFYLFLRGMDGRGGQGVFSDRPDPRQIVAFAGHLQAGISGGER